MRITPLTTVPLALSLFTPTAPLAAQEWVLAEEAVGSLAGPVIGIAAVSSTLDRGRLSGLFVADTSGWISFHSSDGPVRKPLAIESLEPEYLFGEPRGLAYAEPNLYVYDGETHQIWTLDMSEETARRKAYPFKGRLENPSHLAVSPHGLVAVLDGGRLVFLQQGRDPVSYDRSVFRQPEGLNFSAWDTLRVLDRARGSLVTIRLHRLEDGEIRLLSETETLAEAADGAGWRAMAVYGGIPYFATESDVFAYFESDGAVLSVLPAHAGFRDISQIALNANGLYVLDGGSLELLPRPQPILVSLEGDPQNSQAALMALYRYLLDRDMLPTRIVRAGRSYDRLADFLLQEGVLIAPPSQDGGLEVRIVPDAQQTAYRSLRKLNARRDERTAPEDWQELICSLNREICGRGTALVAVEQDQELTLPALEISRQLGRTRLVLENQPLASYVDRLVFSRELREMISPAFLLRLNPHLEAVGEDAILGVSRGFAVVPAEKWTVTSAVPAFEYEDEESALWEFERRFDGVRLYARRSFVAQASRSSLAPPPDEDDDPHCESLRQKRDTWFESIEYPHAWPDLRTKRVRVAILESGSAVLKTHQVFGLDQSQPAWHSFNLLGELVANPDPQSSEPGEQAVLDMATYSEEANHGTHVSALIGGREGRCWSGLLPSSCLVLVDLGNDSFQREIDKAIDAEVRVLSVSQAFDGPRDDLRRLIADDGRALWVVAAGEGERNLDDEDEASVPAPARWGWAHNVVAVTASDWDGRILATVDTAEGSRPGAPRGKRYVDLVAPGDAVVSATDQKKYGPATGTSQATPQVAAAAALLVDRLGERLTPGDVKARLIATADWRSEYKGKVWGGMLDFEAAVRFPDRHILRTTTGAQLRPPLLHSLEPDNDPTIVIVNLPRYYERRGQGDTAPERIQFSQILSLRRQTAGTYRVVFRERGTDRLRIVLDAQLRDANPVLGGPSRIRCRRFERFDPEQQEFVPHDGCANGLSITQIDEYVQGGPYLIQWEESL